MNIICMAGNLYDQKPWTNRQHIMTRLSEMGYKVLYIEPPKSIFRQLVKLIFCIKPEQRVSKWFKRILKIEKREENLYLLSLIKFVPIKYRGLRKLNYLFNLQGIKKQVKKLKMDNSILWIYTPDAVTFVEKLNEKITLYDCVDEYSAQPYYKRNFCDVEKDEIELLKKADGVFVSSQYLYEKKKKLNSNIYFIPNACDYAHFSRAQEEGLEIAEDIANIPKPIIGFVGAIDDYKLDIDLISYLASQRKNWSIVLIGSEAVAGSNKRVSILRGYRNVYFLGEKRYERLPNYIKAFDVAIIPYVENEYTKGCFPIKFFEYLATGEPVIVNGLPELKCYSHVIKIASNREEFIKKISECLKDDTSEERQKRIELAKQNTWENKARRQKEIVDCYLKENK